MIMALTTDQMILGVVSGALIGFTLGLIGSGAGILAVPLLVYLVGIKNIHVAVGTTAAVVMINALTNCYTHARCGHVRWRAIGFFTLAGVFGAAIGAHLGKMLNGQDLLFLFGLLMLWISYQMWRNRKKVPVVSSSSGVRRTPASLGAGFGVGALSGFFGVGGGFLIVPSLIWANGLSIIDAIGSSLAAITIFAGTGAASYALSGLVNWWLVLMLLVGGVVSGYFGSMLAGYLDKSKKGALNSIFVVVIAVVGLYIVWKQVHMLAL